MNKIIGILAIILVINIGIGIFLFTQKSHPPSEFKITTNEPTCSEVVGTTIMEMQSDTFEPQNITIPRCTKVVFKNGDDVPHWPASNIHPTHGIYPEFDPQKGIDPGDEWSFIFAKKGPWKYHDHLYPQTIGTITVK